MNRTYNVEDSNRIVTFGTVSCPLTEIMNDPWNYMLMVGDEPKQIICKAISGFFQNLTGRLVDHYFRFIAVRYS